MTALSDYRGLSNDTGQAIAGDDHLRQSLRDILTTPIGSRVMRRDYGSKIPDLIDAPMTLGRVADIVAAAAEAILAWEPRVTLQRVIVDQLTPGTFTLDLVVQLAPGVTGTIVRVI